MNHLLLALIAATLLTGCPVEGKARASGEYQMKCTYLNPAIDRCENQEAICYLVVRGISCFPKNKESTP